MHHDLVIVGSIEGAMFAERFGLRFYQSNLAKESDEISKSDSILDDLDDVIHNDKKKLSLTQVRQRILFYFQREVMNNFGETILESAEATDDLLDDDDINVVETYKVFKEFTTNNPFLDVLSMWPVDMNGSFAFVVSRKPMSMNSIS